MKYILSMILLIHLSYGYCARVLDLKSTINDIKFDFNYFGDVSGLPMRLRSYDSRISIVSYLGNKKPFNVGISLQATTIEDISNTIARQTNDQVHLIFNTQTNTIRLNYVGGIDIGKDAISESLKWQQGGNPRPVLKRDGVVRFPYGEYQPVVTCQPLNLCDIELQTGEDIQSVVIGDSLRWNEGDQGIPIVYSGPPGSLCPHLVLKPNQSGLDTTLMVTTSRRTYMLRLKSSSYAYVARAGFYYPSEMIQKLEAKQNKPTDVAIESFNTNEKLSLKIPLIDLTKINYAYVIDGSDYMWRPTQVFDDGISVYIQLPHSVDSRSLPSLCVLIDADSSGSKCEMVNFRYTNNFYIVDHLFDNALLINGYGDYVQKIKLKRKPKPGFWSRLFT